MGSVFSLPIGLNVVAGILLVTAIVLSFIEGGTLPIIAGILIIIAIIIIIIAAVIRKKRQFEASTVGAVATTLRGLTSSTST